MSNGVARRDHIERSGIRRNGREGSGRDARAARVAQPRAGLGDRVATEALGVEFPLRVR